ncbi:hypothetical protein HHK36_024470 [Tetracentron sinense]|uniref:Uncharacterized protein n=1 Tax=Tetracentron sinense TaxID=13715 RepID=A0A834YL24_TETSI|nr:hypothetical protein HHK36_024470 [Tetracentron sinense]
MKLSFSLSPKPFSRPNQKPNHNFNEENTTKDDHETKHEYVTEFDASKTLSDNQPKKLVIPPKQNEWRPLKKMKNIDPLVCLSTGDPASSLSSKLRAPPFTLMLACPMLLSEEEVSVGVEEVEDLDSVEEEKCLKKLHDLEI